MFCFQKNREVSVFLFIHIGAFGYALFEFYQFGNGKWRCSSINKVFSYIDRKLIIFSEKSPVEWSLFNARLANIKSQAFELWFRNLFVHLIYFNMLPLANCSLFLYRNCSTHHSTGKRKSTLSYFIENCKKKKKKKINWNRFSFTKKKLPLVHAILGILFVCFNLHPIITLLILMSAMSFYFVMQPGKKHFVWAILMFWLSLSGIVKADMPLLPLFSGHFTFFQLYHGLVAFSWQLLRLASFSFDFCDLQSNSLMFKDKIVARTSNRRFSLSMFLGYAFYMPVFMDGPSFNFIHYANIFETCKQTFFLKRLKQLSLELVHLLIIYLLNELMLHYFHANVICHDKTV